MGDVVTALARAVQDEGHRVTVLIPKYDCLDYDEVKSFAHPLHCCITTILSVCHQKRQGTANFVPQHAERLQLLSLWRITQWSHALIHEALHCIALDLHHTTCLMSHPPDFIASACSPSRTRSKCNAIHEDVDVSLVNRQNSTRYDR